MTVPPRNVPEWTPLLALDVEPIDGQHRELFRRAAVLIATAETRAEEGQVLQMLAFLGDYVVTHFSAEEALMAERGYPGLAAHAAEHAALTSTFRRLRAEFARAGVGATLAEAVRRDVCEWLVGHIDRTDRALAAFLHGAA